MAVSDFIPYCGDAPIPGETQWNLDPVLIAGLAGIAVLYAAGAGRARLSRRERLLFGAGLALVAGAMISPLCNLSVALFSARVTQHLILTLAAAPLIALGRCDLAARALLHRGVERTAPAGSPIAALLFAAAMWVWHLPGPYDATLRDNAVYWIMHVTTFGTALLLWQLLLCGGEGRIGSVLIATFATAVQMSLLGAILSQTQRPLFEVHRLTTHVWGLSALEDQQLGGLLLWVPAGLIFTVLALAALGHRLRLAEEQRPSRPAAAP